MSKKNQKVIKKESSLKYWGVVVILLAVVAILTPTLAKNLKYGLDLKGGFEVLYEVESLNGEEVNESMVESTYRTIVKRIDVLGVSEPVIQIEGTNRIRVQLAGVTDKETARQTLSSVASLSFRDTEDNLLMTSEVLKSNGAKIGEDSKGLPAVSLQVKDNDTFYKVTKEISKRDDNQIVIWLDFEEGVDSYSNEKANCGEDDSKCLSAASVSEGFAGDVIIQGNFTKDKVKTLVELINSGSLSTKLNEISSKTVDASFGANSLNKTFTAGLIGLIIVMIFMVVFYRFGGLISAIGLIAYTFLTFLIFWLVGGVLTLPGIAAMLLGIGMAVDANVINFARIKDELSQGKKFKDAYRLGNKGSLLTIIDANVTTLIASIILFIFGESSIKGFATMLMISIAVTLFVMVFIVRNILNMFVATNMFDEKPEKFCGKPKNFDKIENFKYAEKKRIFLTITLIVFVIGFISLGTNKLNLGIDFKGGSSISIVTDNELTEENITKDIEELGYKIESIDDAANNTHIVVIEDKLDENQVLKTQEYFKDKYEASTDIGVISNIVRNELIKNALLSLVLAIIGIIVYVSIRFTFSYAISGIVALVHDAVLVVLIFSLLRLEVSTIFVAAILSIIGYSINDTIVLFDRMRENKAKLYKNKIKSKEELNNLLNTSIKSTIKRNIFTSLTTLIPVVCLLIFGSHEILNFNLAMLFGLIAGSYSSLFIAGYIWIMIESKQIGKAPKKKWYETEEPEEMKIKGINS